MKTIFVMLIATLMAMLICGPPAEALPADCLSDSTILTTAPAFASDAHMAPSATDPPAPLVPLTTIVGANGYAKMRAMRSTSCHTHGRGCRGHTPLTRGSAAGIGVC